MHSWQNGTRCRDGVKVLWCHSHLVWLVFEGSIPTCACFHSENFVILIHGYQTCPLVESFSGCNVSFAEVEDCLELNFRYVDYQTLAHLSYSSYVCWISVCAARAKRFLSVRVSINASKPDQNETHCEG